MKFMLDSAEREISIAYKGKIGQNKISIVFKFSDVAIILLIYIRCIFGYFNIYERDKLHAQLS